MLCPVDPIEYVEERERISFTQFLGSGGKGKPRSEMAPRVGTRHGGYAPADRGPARRKSCGDAHTGRNKVARNDAGRKPTEEGR